MHSTNPLALVVGSLQTSKIMGNMLIVNWAVSPVSARLNRRAYLSPGLGWSLFQLDLSGGRHP